MAIESEHLPSEVGSDSTAVSSRPCESWQCMLCRDLSDLALLQDYSGTDGGLCMCPPDQMRCERLLLVLLCRKCSVVLYRSAKLSSRSSHYIDITMIRGQLLRKLVPPYCTPSEFVSDVWLLLHTLLKSVKVSGPTSGMFWEGAGQNI
ncbi:transcription intermediary factor 1-beta-like isoform X2 [Oncorhynchus nerka]|uniref:transcription intermediary factor 1-beta-like isoform X2 n=1 Tax=Oncorhynchus nerka TaxID=8023 RepID=UPI001130AEAB|nr:transcription intermediary factor 1-beta-like [Oncorhynchus nerka]